MPLFKFGKQPSGSIYQTRGVPSTRSGTVGKKQVTAFGGGPGYQTNRYNPTHDRLEEGSVVEDWIPRDLPGINKMMRQIYTRDAIAGPTVDLWSNLPWSSAEVMGVDDPTILKFFQDFMSCFDPTTFGPEISREVLVTGRMIGSLLYDEKKGYWTGIIPHDSDFCFITPIPVKGYDPKIDLQLSPAVRQFMNSVDPRDAAAREALPDSTLKQLQSGGRIPLDPMATLYIARKSAPHDYVGTSFFTRIIPFWALEKALTNATVTAARRRAGNILHVAVGIDDRWEPEPSEMEDIAGMFVQADEDPVGAVVVTRTGVAPQEIRQGGQLWKMSDEWQFLSEGKMRALGINDAFLSGEATYNNLEQTMSVFLEQIRTFREWMTRQTYYRMFETLARAHGFRKRKQADLDHGVRTGNESDEKNPNTELPMNGVIENKGITRKEDGTYNFSNPTQQNALKISRDQLVVPSLHYSKSLKPEADKEYLEILTAMEEKGLPVPLKKWAAAGGYDIDEAVDSAADDVKLRGKIAKWKKDIASIGGQVPGDSEDGGGDDAGAAGADTNELNQVPLWDPSKRFMGVSYTEAVGCLETISASSKMALASSRNLMKVVSEYFKHDQKKFEAMNYLLMRLGTNARLDVSQAMFKNIANHIATVNKNKPKTVVKELFVLNRLTQDSEKRNKFTEAEFNKIVSRYANVRDDVKNESGIASSSPNLLTGSMI